MPGTPSQRTCPQCGVPIIRTHHCTIRPTDPVPMPKDFRQQIRQHQTPEPDRLPIEGLDT